MNVTMLAAGSYIVISIITLYIIARPRNRKRVLNCALGTIAGVSLWLENLGEGDDNPPNRNRH